MKKVISFSLWGENPKYTIGAIKNADLATVFYPDWICRFYVAKNVPLHVIQELLARNNTEVFIVNEKPDWSGMFWRFFAACDPFVDVMISRDTDSRLGQREMLAVKEWESSDRGFHIMRDHPQHGTKIMGGMWGIKKGHIQNIAELIKNYQKGDFHQVDQKFLREVIYPLIHDNVLVHDPIFDKKPFPSQRVGYQFVGQVFDEHDQPIIGHLEQLKQFLQSHPDPCATSMKDGQYSKHVNAPTPGQIQEFMTKNHFVEVARVSENLIEDNVMYRNTTSAEPRLTAGAPQENMKVLIIQENGRHSKNRHFRECFALQSAFQRLGWQADIWGLGHPEFPSLAFSETGGGTLLSGSGQGGINKTLDFNAYDVIFNLENYDQIGWAPSLTHVKAYKIMWAIDAHVRGMTPYRELYLRDRYDMMLQSTRDFIVEEEDAHIKKNSIWFPNCLNDALIYPLDVDKKYDIGFCGNIVNREPYLSFVEKSFQLKRDIFVIGADMVHAINSYKIHFNKNIANDINYRNFETLGCRTLLLTNANPQYIDLGFVDGENCLIYRNLSELQDKIQYTLDHPQQREQIAENGYQLSKRHTYNERVKSLITLLQRKV